MKSQPKMQRRDTQPKVVWVLPISEKLNSEIWEKAEALNMTRNAWGRMILSLAVQGKFE